MAIGYGGSHDDAAAKLGKSGDGGVDGAINQDLLGLERVYVQAKRYASAIPIGRPALQAFVGSLVGFGASKGVFVTTSSFTAQAVGYADQVPQRVALIDGQRLAELLIRYKVGVRTGRTIELKELDENYVADEE